MAFVLASTSCVNVVILAAVRDRLPYLRSLGVGALILEGLFPRGLPAPAIMKLDESLGTLPHFQQLLAEGHKTGE